MHDHSQLKVGKTNQPITIYNLISYWSVFLFIFFLKQWNYFTNQKDFVCLGWKILEICLIYYKKYAHFLISLSNHRLTIIFTEICTFFFLSSFRTFFLLTGWFQCVFHLVFLLLEYIKWRMTKTNLEMSIDSLLVVAVFVGKQCSTHSLTHSSVYLLFAPLCVSQLFRFRANAAAWMTKCACVCWMPECVCDCESKRVASV